MRYFGVSFLVISALLGTGAKATAQHAGGYGLAPPHSAFTFAVHAAPFSHDPSLHVFFVLEVGGHSHVAPGVVYAPAPHFHEKQLKRHRKLHRELAKLERKRARAAFKSHQKARREALKRQEEWEREAFKRARKLEREFERDARQRYLVALR